MPAPQVVIVRTVAHTASTRAVMSGRPHRPACEDLSSGQVDAGSQVQRHRHGTGRDEKPTGS
jgi:hypothetical protein